jgi:hypothetical protein
LRSSLASSVTNSIPLAVLIAACSTGPPAPTPWFNEHLLLYDTPTPAGVQFSVAKDYSNKGVDFTDHLVIVNTASTPLLLEALPPPEGGYYREIACPRNLCLKAESGQAFEWRTPLFEPEAKPSWQPADPYDEEAPLALYVTGRSLGNGNYTVLWLDLRNEFSSDRPPDVEVPEPQQLSLKYLYGSEEMVLPITVTYSLNHSYSPLKPLSPWIFVAPVILAAVLLLILLAALFNHLLSFLQKRAMSRDPTGPHNNGHPGAA